MELEIRIHTFSTGKDTEEFLKDLLERFRKEVDEATKEFEGNLHWQTQARLSTDRWENL